MVDRDLTRTLAAFDSARPRGGEMAFPGMISFSLTVKRLAVPEGLTPEFLFRFLESAQRSEVATSMGDGSPSILDELGGIVERARTWHFDRFENGEGDAELSHFAWLCYLSGNYVQKLRGREAALPYYVSAWRAFNHLEGKGRKEECDALLAEYPEVRSMIAGGAGQVGHDLARSSR